MNSSIRRVFLLAVMVQALHSVEEFIFKLYEVFPPMVFIYRNHRNLAMPAFVAFNLLLLLFGLVCYLYRVRPARKGASIVAWAWVGVQLATVAAHVVWAVLMRGYHPGLVTMPAVALVSVYLTYELRRVPSTLPPNKSFDRARN